MDFWTLYADQCLQSPWVIHPEKIHSGFEIRSQKVFVYEGELSDEASVMLSKMVGALQYQPDQVTLLSSDAIDNLQDVSKSLQIVFFGKNCPGRFGEALHWAGHQVVQTHDLQSLLNQPELKKETWAHLKLFASLK